MTAIKWKYNTDGLWSNAANWSGGVLPGSADDVTLDTLSYHTVTYASGTTEINSLTAVTDSLSITGGSLGILSTALFDQALTTTGGTLALLGASASIAGTFNAISGEITLATATTFSVTGSAIFDTDAYEVNGVEIDGAGTLSTTGSTTVEQSEYGNNTALYLGGGITWDIGASVLDAGLIDAGDANGLTAAIVNPAGKTFDFTTDTASILNGRAVNGQNQTVYGSSTFSNAGTIAKTGGTATSYVDSLFTDTGVITAATGTLEFDGGGSFAGTLGGAGQIAFGGGTATITGSAAALTVSSLLFDGAVATFAKPESYAGTLNLISGSVTFDGAANTIAAYSQTGQNGDHLYLNGNSLTIANGYFGSGYLEGAGTLTTSGTTTVSGWNGYSYEAGSNVTWINTGTLSQAFYLYVDYTSGAGFNFINDAGATYDMTGDFTLGANNADGTGSTFVNNGTFAKTVGTNTNNIYSVFTNAGTINAATGTIEFDGGGVFGGSLTGTGTVSFGGGSATLASGISITSANLLVDGATVTLAANLSLSSVNYLQTGGLVDLAGNRFTAANGDFGEGIMDGPGTVTTTGTTSISGYNGGALELGGGLAWTNDGLANLDGNLYIDYPSGSGFTFTNAAGASFDILGNFIVGNNNANGTSSTFSNAGTFAKVGGTGTSEVISDFTNASTGVVTSAVGNLEFDGNGSFGGALTGTGTISLASGTYTLLTGAKVSAASFLIDGADLTLAESVSQTASQFTMSSGTLALAGFTLALAGADFGGGTINGPGTISTSGTNILGGYNGYFTAYFGGGLTLNNTGTIDQNYNLDINYLSGAGFTINNKAGATYDFTNNYQIGGNNGNGVTSSFTNSGLFESTGGTNVTTVTSIFTNTGTINVTTGTIEFNGGGTFGGSITGTGGISFNNATFAWANLASGAGDSDYLYYSGVSLSGKTTIAGTLGTQSSSITLASAATLSVSGTLNVEVPGQGLPLDGPGTLVTTGQVNIVDWYNNGVMLSVGGGSTWQNSGTINAAGIVQIGDSDLIGGTAAGTIVNTAAGIFDFTTDDAALYEGSYYNPFGNQLSSGGSFVNAGLLEKTGGTAISRFYAILDSTGTLATTTGTIALYAGGDISGKIADGSNIVFGSGSFTDAALSVGGGATLSNAATISATAGLTLGDTSASVAGFTNSGIYLLEGNFGIADAGTAKSAFTNTGTLEKAAGTTTSLISAALINSGTIIGAAGTLALTGSVTGTGAIVIDAGATLELGAGIAASQTVSFTAPTETLLLASPTKMPATIDGLTVGDVIDLTGVTATKAVVNASDQLLIYDNTSVVATLQLAGSYLSDSFTTGTITGGSSVTLAAAVSSYKGVNADWYSTNVWTNGPPTAQTAASVSLAGTYTLTLNGGETATVATLALKAADATYQFAGTLDVTTSVTVSAGDLQLTGLIDGGKLINTGGGSITFGSNSELLNVAYLGKLDLSENYANVRLAGTFSLAGAAGTGLSTINLTGYQAYLYVFGDETLNDATVNIGNDNSYSYLSAYDTNGQGDILTLGPSLAIVQAGTYASLQDSGNDYDGIYNDGKITAGLSGGTFTITGNDFENDGSIAVSNGDTFNINAAQFVNTGTFTVTSAILGITGTYANTGTLTAKNTTLNFATSLTGSQLAAIDSPGGDTLNLSGTLTDAGTLLVGAGQKIVALTLSGEISSGTITPTAGAFTFETGSILDDVTFNGTMAVGSGVTVTLDGTIANAVIADSGSGIVFDPGVELDKVSYQGTVNLASGNTVEVLGGLKLTGTGGTGQGSIDAAAGASMTVLSFLDTETLSNVSITSGASGTGTQGLYLAAAATAGGTLTLASTTTFTVQAATDAGMFSISPTTGLPLHNAIVNDGTIGIGDGATFLGSDGSVSTFTNAGTITLGESAAWVTSAGTLTTAKFVNAAAGNLSLGTDASFETNGGGMSNAGSITLANGAVLTVQGAYSETGTASVASGASFNIDGPTTLASLAGIGGDGTLGIDGLLNLAGATFSMAATGRIANVQIGGELEGGTFANNAGTVTFGSLATLSAMTWKGALDIGGGSTVDVLNGLTVETGAGGTPGAINLTGNATAGAGLDYVATGLVDNVTISSSSPSAGVGSPALANLLALGTAGGTLTLGAHFVLDATAGATEIADSAGATAAGTLVNNGHINVTGGALWLDPSIATFTNAAFITLSADTEFDPTPGSTGSTNFSNSGTVDLISLDDFDVSGNGTNAALLTIGTGSEVTFGGSFANTGTITIANGGSLTAGGTLTNTGTIIAGGATSDFIAATAGAGSAFNAGTLTGGTWDVSAGSTLTIEFGGNLTTDAADISLAGTGSVLRSVGATIERLESSLATIATGGTLSVTGGRGYTTTLALTDNGTLQLQGGTLSAGGLTLAAAAELTGSGTVATSISNAGTVDAAAGTLTLSDGVTGAGLLQIEKSSVLELGAAAAETVLFKGADSELKLDAPTTFTGTLSGFAAGDSLLLVSTTATAAVLSGSTLTVSLSGGSTEKFDVAGNSATVTLTVAESGGNALLTYPAAQASSGPIVQAAPSLRFVAAPQQATHPAVASALDHRITDFAPAAHDVARWPAEAAATRPDQPSAQIGAGMIWAETHLAAEAAHAVLAALGRE